MKSKRIVALIMAFLVFSMTVLCDYKTTYAVIGVDDAILLILGGVIGAASGAAIAEEQSGSIYSTWYENNRDTILKNRSKLLQAVGLPAQAADLMSRLGTDPIQEIKLYQKKKYNNENVTDDEAKQMIFNMYKNCVVGDHNFVMSNEMKEYVKWMGQYMLSYEPCRDVYSTDLRYLVNNFSNGVNYNYLKKIVQQYQDNYYVQVRVNGSNVKLYPKNSKYQWVDKYNENGFYGCNPYNYVTWQETRNYPGCKGWEYTINGEEVVETPKEFTYVPDSGWGFFNSKYNSIENAHRPNEIWMTYGRIETTTIFMSLSDLKKYSIGERSVYTTNTWNNFVNNGGNTYNIDNSNINRVDYGDTQNIINNYYNEHNTYYCTS